MMVLMMMRVYRGMTLGVARQHSLVGGKEGGWHAAV